MAVGRGGSRRIQDDASRLDLNAGGPKRAEDELRAGDGQALRAEEADASLANIQFGSAIIGEDPRLSPRISDTDAIAAAQDADQAVVEDAAAGASADEGAVTIDDDAPAVDGKSEAASAELAQNGTLRPIAHDTGEADLQATAAPAAPETVDSSPAPRLDAPDSPAPADPQAAAPVAPPREAVTLTGTPGRDTLSAAGSDQAHDIYGLAGNDRLIGGNADDHVFGEGGADRLYGHVGADMLDGGDGNDRLYGGDGDDALAGGSGRDLLYGQDGNDSMDGGASHDRLYGGDGDDTLTGGAGNDRLYGQAGADALSGGAGNDRLYVDAADTLIDGGAGNDRVDVQGSAGVALDMNASSVETAVGNAGDDRFRRDRHGGRDAPIRPRRRRHPDRWQPRRSALWRCGCRHPCRRRRRRPALWRDRRRCAGRRRRQ